MNKTIATAADAVARVKDGAVIMMGGFGVCGIPENLVAALRESGAKNLTLVSNNAGLDDFGIGTLLKNGQIRKMILSYGGECRVFEDMALAKQLEVEWTPQGTLAERIRAGGAGIGGFFTPTGYGTLVAEGKETRRIDGRWMVFERPLKADFSFVKAWKGDALGNLEYRKTARNLNQIMATAGDCVIAEVEQFVDIGGLHPDHIHTPGIYVDMVLRGPKYVKPIEKLTLRKAASYV
ncbi:MAG TPA: succinyl-CoA--3-ketoacid-CoA transferase [Elusimicrobia bacterium]|nr:MAG: succinyl-CoA--3-ketoacid-CoA transferase [Elusimicrobia bacterium GWA2_66_18]OGR76703.1 MAG: succinyl-CoA--3-ketoacid-CoA transferase [Elusimicrobia bacterium GWC2_65_9]HAZ07225.1 succinyl-CoA--3-ketoacid-CoA transferase [Elusimicrobiota bacterium]